MPYSTLKCTHLQVSLQARAPQQPRETFIRFRTTLSSQGLAGIYKPPDQTPDSRACFCSGKSTVGKLAARALKYPFLDSDQIAQAHDGRTISEIFEAEGEEGFRELESAVLQVILRQGLGAAICFHHCHLYLPC